MLFFVLGVYTVVLAVFALSVTDREKTVGLPCCEKCELGKAIAVRYGRNVPVDQLGRGSRAFIHWASYSGGECGVLPWG